MKRRGKQRSLNHEISSGRARPPSMLQGHFAFAVDPELRTYKHVTGMTGVLEVASARQ
jgi:hypothetical protein